MGDILLNDYFKMKMQLQAAKYYGTGEASAECKLFRDEAQAQPVPSASCSELRYYSNTSTTAAIIVFVIFDLLLLNNCHLPFVDLR